MLCFHLDYVLQPHNRQKGVISTSLSLCGVSGTEEVVGACNPGSRQGLPGGCRPTHPGVLLLGTQRDSRLFRICCPLWFCARHKHCPWLGLLWGCGQQNSGGCSSQQAREAARGPLAKHLRSQWVFARDALQEAHVREAEDGFSIVRCSARTGQLCKATAVGAHAANTSCRQMMH